MPRPGEAGGEDSGCGGGCYRRLVHQLPEALPIKPATIRLIGLAKFVAALAAVCGLWWLSGPMDVLNEVLLLFGMSGLLDLFTGLWVSETARQWDALKPWQRAVASLLVILSAIGCFIALGTLLLEVNE